MIELEYERLKMHLLAGKFSLNHRYTILQSQRLDEYIVTAQRGEGLEKTIWTCIK